MRIDEIAPTKMNVDQVVKDFGRFLQLCKEELELEKLPKIKWITDGSHHKKHHSFGSFHNDDQVLYVEITDRHPIDIMRTTAHELVHYKQYLENRIKPGSGETGSDIENEANAVAGIIMRHFDDANPKAFDYKPVDSELMEAEAWQKASGKNKNGGLNKKGVASYRRSHPGSKLQTAVTTKPSKLKKGSKAAKRRKSFCARMKGMKKRRTSAKTAHDPNSRINKSLRKWHCESIEEMRDMILTAEAYIAEEKQRLDAKCWKGYRKAGTKMKGGVRVNNCVPNESVDEGKWNYPKDIKGSPTDDDHYLGTTDRKRTARKEFRRSEKAKAHKELMTKKTNGNVDEAANAAQQAAIAIAKKKDKTVDENFADGKGPGRPGDSARHGIPKHATMSELEKASHAKGRKGQLARWQLNMRRGKK